MYESSGDFPASFQLGGTSDGLSRASDSLSRRGSAYVNGRLDGPPTTVHAPRRLAHSKARSVAGEPEREDDDVSSHPCRRVRVMPPEDRPLVVRIIVAGLETVPTGTVVPCPGA